MNIELPWEKMADGKHAIHKIATKITINPAFLKQLAIAKMMDVKLISADFNNAPAVFSPRVCLLLDFSSHINFFGVYELSKSNQDDDEKESSPFFCIRQSRWNKQEDIEGIKTNKNESVYLMGENQMSSNVIFTGLKQVPEISNLIFEIVNLMKQGLQFQERSSNGVLYQDAKLSIFDESLQFSFSSNRYMLENIHLNEWIVKWSKCIGDIPSDITLIPDDLFRFSYHMSLSEKIRFLSENYIQDKPT